MIYDHENYLTVSTKLGFFWVSLKKDSYYLGSISCERGYRKPVEAKVRTVLMHGPFGWVPG